MSNRTREVVAGIAGFLTFNVASALLFTLSGYDPYSAVSTSFRVVSIVAGVLFALGAGYLTALLSPASPVRPAVMVALLIGVIAVMSMLVSGSGEAWSQLAALLLMAPAVVAGARIRAKRGWRNSSGDAIDG